MGEPVWTTLRKIQTLISIVGSLALVGGIILQFYAIPGIREKSAVSWEERIVDTSYTGNVFLFLLGIAMVCFGFYILYKRYGKRLIK